MKIKLRKKIKILANKRKRRGRRKTSKNIIKSLRFLGVNAAGLRSKSMTFEKVLNELKPSVFLLKKQSLRTQGN